MSATAAEVVAQELIQWLEKEDYLRFTEVQRLEAETRIWQYAKWCCSGVGVSGIKPQIPYRGSPPESTWWDTLPDMSDDDAMRINHAARSLSPQQLEVLRRFYIQGQDTDYGSRRMRIRKQRFCDLRREGLRKISEKLKISVDWELETR